MTHLALQKHLALQGSKLSRGTGGKPLPRPAYGLISASKDGSTGQTYTLNASWTAVQWYRMSPISGSLVKIAGATGLTHVAVSGDQGSRLVAIGLNAGVLAAAKSYQVVLSAPILIEAFDATTGIAASAGGVITADMVNKVQGAASLSLVGTGTANAKAVKADIGTFDFGPLNVMATYLDLGQDAELQSVVEARIIFSRTGTGYYVTNVTGPDVLYLTPATLFTGGYWQSFNISEVPLLGGIGSGVNGVSVTEFTNIPHAAPTKFDSMLGNAGGRPSIVLGFDDIKDTQYSVAYPMLKARNMAASVHVVLGNVGAANRLTLAQLQELYANGWDMCLNGSADDGQMTGKASVAAAITEMQTISTYLAANGMPRGNEHICYPNGAYQTPGTKVLVAAVTSTGTGVVTMASTAGILAGMEVRGYQVPAGTTVTSNDSGTQLTLNHNVPAQTVPMSFTTTSGAFHTMKLPIALAAAGIKTARTTLARGSIYTRMGFAGRGLTMPGNAASSLTLPQLTALVDEAILRGNTLEFYIHGVSDGGGIDTGVANFTGLLDYIQGKRDAGLLDVVTKSELWGRDGGATVPV